MGRKSFSNNPLFLEPVVKSRDQSTLSPWASWGLGTQASVLQWPWHAEEETGRDRRQRCSNWGSDGHIQGLLGGGHITLKHIKNWPNIGVFIVLSYKAGGTHGVGVDFTPTPTHSYTHLHRVYLYHADALVSGLKSLHRGAFLWTKVPLRHHRRFHFKTSGSDRSTEEAILSIFEQWFRNRSGCTVHNLAMVPEPPLSPWDVVLSECEWTATWLCTAHKIRKAAFE